MKVLTGLMVAMAFIFIIGGCKKDDPSTTTPQNKCNISSIVSGGSSIAIAYNANGTINTVTTTLATGGPIVRSYSYSGNTITESLTDAGLLFGNVIVTVNNAGLATNVRSEVVYGTWNNQPYEYNGNQVSKGTYTSSDGSDAEATTYQWSDGNMVSINDDGDVTNIAYYTDKATQQGDDYSVLQLLQGYEFIRNKNMVKSGTDGTDVTNITYVFDNDGKITSWTADDGTNQPAAYGLSYQCN